MRSFLFILLAAFRVNARDLRPTPRPSLPLLSLDLDEVFNLDRDSKPISHGRSPRIEARNEGKIRTIHFGRGEERINLRRVEGRRSRTTPPPDDYYYYDTTTRGYDGEYDYDIEIPEPTERIPKEEFFRLFPTSTPIPPSHKKLVVVEPYTVIRKTTTTQAPKRTTTKTTEAPLFQIDFNLNGLFKGVFDFINNPTNAFSLDSPIQPLIPGFSLPSVQSHKTGIQKTLDDVKNSDALFGLNTLISMIQQPNGLKSLGELLGASQLLEEPPPPDKTKLVPVTPFKEEKPKISFSYDQDDYYNFGQEESSGEAMLKLSQDTGLSSEELARRNDPYYSLYYDTQ